MGKKDQPYTNTDMMGMTTTLKLTSKPTNTVTDMPPTVNTVSIFLMAVPKLSPTTSPMLTEDMLLMSNTKVLLNTQNTTQPSLLTTQPNQLHIMLKCCSSFKTCVFIHDIYSINRIDTEIHDLLCIILCHLILIATKFCNILALR